MRNLGLVVLALSAACAAQQQTPPQQASQMQSQVVKSAQTDSGNTPTKSDLYCSGFIASQKVPADHYVIGGGNSPMQSRFAGATDQVFIKGSGMKEGDRWEILRPVKDMDHYQVFPGQSSAVRSAGQPYFEMGYVSIIGVQNDIGIGVPELSCTEIVPGDIAVPYVEREKPVFRVVTLDKYAPPDGKAVGRIILANEFDTDLGSKSKVYLNIGANKGLKPGDYLRITRTYNSASHDTLNGLSMNPPMSDMQDDTPHVYRSDYSSLPRLTVGDMMILSVQPKSATGMIMTALQDVRVGDGVEVMDVSNAPEVAAVAPAAQIAPAPGIAPMQAPAAPPEGAVAVAPAPAPSAATGVENPPTISCTASPSSLRLGESSTISCNAVSPDNRPVVVTFTASAGHVSPNGTRATLDTTDTMPGPITVRATAFDDRNLTAATTTTVTVEAPPPPAPVAQKATELDFKPGSSYVDNRSKAELDDIALPLQKHPPRTLLGPGSSDQGEKPTMAADRAQNTMNYLTRSKGIDGKRIQVKTSSQTGHKVDIWTIPAGAAAPQF